MVAEHPVTRAAPRAMNAPPQDQVAATYATAHVIYRAAGWPGPLPLPPGAKWPPPEGWTGWTGAYPSHADSTAWTDPSDYGDTRQTALRMATDVIGIDVDHYGSKRGADTIAEAERRWGPLPRAPYSSARGAGPSGIRFYRVPSGTTLRTRIGFPDLGLGDVEIIQRHHRYAVVWPSTNPHADSAPYLWYETSGPDVPPLAEFLNELPAAWIKALAGADEPGASAADPEAVAAFSRAHATGSAVGALRGVLAVFERTSAAGTRHDAMVDAACMAAREARAGRYPAAEARRALRDAFVLALAAARPGQRLVPPADARREFESIWSWAVAQALAMTVQECQARAGVRPEPAVVSSGRGPAAATTERERRGPVAATAGLADTTATMIDQAETKINVQASSSPNVIAAGPDGEHVQRSESVFSHGSSEPTAEELAAAEFDRRLRDEIQRQDVRALAEEARAARDRAPLRRMSASEFLAAPQPTYLVPGLLYQDSLAVVFGPPGAAKTFFTLDLALSLAAGRPWRGEVAMPRTRVHYLMAEGQAVNVGRTLAWLTHHGVPAERLDGWFDAFPEPLSLTPVGVADYLREVRQDRPGLIVLDTKHAMMEGDESKAADVKVMRDALTMIRQATGACVLLVDHTGLADDTRARGSNSQKAMVATEIRITESAGVRTAEVMRNTAGEVGETWSFALEQVPAAPRPPGTAVPVVPLPTSRREPAAALRGAWWDVNRSELPEAVAALAGVSGEAACDIFRVLVEANDQDGLTVAQIVGLLRDGPRKHSRSTVYNAVGRLGELGVILPAVGAKQWVLAPAYVGWSGRPNSPS